MRTDLWLLSLFLRYIQLEPCALDMIRSFAGIFTMQKKIMQKVAYIINFYYTHSCAHRWMNLCALVNFAPFLPCPFQLHLAFTYRTQTLQTTLIRPTFDCVSHLFRNFENIWMQFTFNFTFNCFVDMRLCAKHTWVHLHGMALNPYIHLPVSNDRQSFWSLQLPKIQRIHCWMYTYTTCYM